MKTTELIAALNDSVARWGDRDVWIGSDLLLSPLRIEVWQEPYFDQPSVVILVTDKGGPSSSANPRDLAAND